MTFIPAGKSYDPNQYCFCPNGFCSWGKGEERKTLGEAKVEIDNLVRCPLCDHPVEKLELFGFPLVRGVAPPEWKLGDKLFP